jgi:hypothetical protein
MVLGDHWPQVLNGLFAVDHMLLALAVDDPLLVTMATKSIKDFIANPANR